jgi:tetratricopeptide (TPR) repeat protein
MTYPAGSSLHPLIPMALASFIVCFSSHTFATDIQPAVVAYKEMHFDLAKPLFETAAKDTATKNDSLYYLGRIAFDEGDAEKAKDYLDKSVTIEPNSSDEYYWLGRAYGELAQHANILKQASYASDVHKYFQLAVDADPKNIAAQRGLFAFYIMAPGIMGGGVDKAEKTLADIRLLSPVDADIKQLDIFIKKEESDKSLAQAKFLVATYPASAEALFSAAHTFRNHKKLEDAIVSFEAASKLTITPQNRMFVENSMYLFGETCLWANTRVDDGIVSIEKFLTVTTGNKNVNKNWPYWTLAKLYRQKGDLGKYQSLRSQLDPAFIKQDKWMKDEVEKQDKQDKKS